MIEIIENRSCDFSTEGLPVIYHSVGHCSLCLVHLLVSFWSLLLLFPPPPRLLPSLVIDHRCLRRHLPVGRSRNSLLTAPRLDPIGLALDLTSVLVED